MVDCVCAGDVELELPEGMPDFDPDRNRIRPSAGEPDQDSWVSTSRRTTYEGALPTVPEGTLDQRTSNGSIKLLTDLAPDQLAAAQQEQQKGLQVTHFCMLNCLSAWETAFNGQVPNGTDDCVCVSLFLDSCVDCDKCCCRAYSSVTKMSICTSGSPCWLVSQN